MKIVVVGKFIDLIDVTRAVSFVGCSEELGRAVTRADAVPVLEAALAKFGRPLPLGPTGRLLEYVRFGAEDSALLEDRLRDAGVPV